MVRYHPKWLWGSGGGAGPSKRLLEPEVVPGHPLTHHTRPRQQPQSTKRFQAMLGLHRAGSLVGAAFGTSGNGWTVAATALLPRLTPQMLLLADRAFDGDDYLQAVSTPALTDS